METQMQHTTWYIIVENENCIWTIIRYLERLSYIQYILVTRDRNVHHIICQYKYDATCIINIRDVFVFWKADFMWLISDMLKREKVLINSGTFIRNMFHKQIAKNISMIDKIQMNNVLTE